MSLDDKHLRQISQRLSLRKPQTRSLEILADVVNRIELAKDTDLVGALADIQAEYPTVQDFERNFPSLCFALATGVGKTRLMGACCAFLHLTGRSNNFFILAPNTTIYEKLIDDFSTTTSPKYVFRGISQFAQKPPIIVTGDTWQEGRGVVSMDLFGGEAVINIFNVDKINKDKGKVKRLHEYIGQSYFDYLAGLPDLVLMMDEAHRYRAKAGMKAVAELKPILGLEMTATPKTVGANPKPFMNVIFDYGLGNAMADGYVKEPAVATRANFKKSDFDADQLEAIMLEDAIHNHENLKAELDVYARDGGRPLVHPFVLVVAQDTAHASQLKERMESPDFFQGRYKGRVAEIHSNLKGEESDEAMERLIGLETDRSTDIVIHVNKLKEGWDVTNLYTIVPLRASASDILTEQTLGRGLRLPYGERTGNEAVDTLTVIAHDRFDEVIAKAREDGSLVQVKAVTIGEGGDVEDKPAEVVEAPSILETRLGGRSAPLGGMGERPTEPLVFDTEGERSAALTTLDIIRKKMERKLGSVHQLATADVQAELVREVEQATAPVQGTLDGLAEKTDYAKVVATVSDEIIKSTIEIPDIVVIPTREVTFGFHDFNLDGLENINFQPISDEILIRNLRTEQQTVLARSVGGTREARLEDYIVRHLIVFDEIDYDTQADLLYKLAGQVLDRLREYLSDASDFENVALAHGRKIADFILSQMMKHYWETPADYQVQVARSFRLLESQSFHVTKGQMAHDFRRPVAPLSHTKKHVFTGFMKNRGNELVKFDSDGERRFSVLLEREADVRGWLKPGPNQFQIEYRSGKGYEPDFVIETDTKKFIVEVKARRDLQTDDVVAKANAARTWVKNANDHSASVGSKPWTYLLVPDDEIAESTTLDALIAKFDEMAPA